MTMLFTHGNILLAKQECITIPVNCVGVMGAGLALLAKHKWPEMAREYAYACACNQMRVGRIWPHKTYDNIIICFPTKDHWRDPSQMSFIVSGLINLSVFINLYRPKSIAIPKIGCGHSGLLWSDVLPKIEYYLEDAAKICDVVLYV